MTPSVQLRTARTQNPRTAPVTSSDMVAYVDKMVGKIVSKLDELGLRENTLVLFTCDNGTSGAIKSELHGKIVQGGKRQMTDAGTHVPLIANWPKTIPGKQVKEELVDFSDFLPTLLGCGQISPTYQPHFGWTEFPSPNHWQARKPKKMGALFLQGKRRSGKFQQWARTQRYKLYNTGKFYDVSQDRLEKNPLQKLIPQIRRKDSGQCCRVCSTSFPIPTTRSKKACSGCPLRLQASDRSLPR